MAQAPSLTLNRLRVTRRGALAYDQKFHEGVNIIRGENGSGKSTVADFIFYILGGEFDDWKEAASLCDEVHAEIETNRGKLTLRRDIGKRTTPIKVFFGPFDKADAHTLEGWETFPIRRQESRESFSQVLFRSLHIPETQSEGASNITMHQIMRLLYSDQRTPSTRLFRFETFDTQNMREAVGDLVCGIGGYEIYEIGLKLRDLEGEFEIVSRKLSSLIEALPSDERLNRPESITTRQKELEAEIEKISADIQNVDTLVDPNQTVDFLKERRSAHASLQRKKKKIADVEALINKYELELAELEDFLSFLTDLVQKVGLAEKTQSAIGGIEFTQCPACLADLKSTSDPHTCHVCGAPTDPEAEKSKYNQIRLDLEIQMRESHQLVEEKSIALRKSTISLRQLNRDYSKALSEFLIKYDLSSSPRESYLAAKNQRIGQIEQELGYLTRALESAEEIQRLSAKKSELQSEIQELKDRREALEKNAHRRRSGALTQVSDLAAALLRNDLDRQPEFRNAKSVILNFRDDAIFVDGRMNFAESSNVFLKNAAIFGMFLAAGQDDEFFHPRLLLLDNIEDKGMEPERSHLFQKLIVEHSTELVGRNQVIFTTSMMNPALELDDYVVGPHYTHDVRTLSIQS